MLDALVADMRTSRADVMKFTLSEALCEEGNFLVDPRSAACWVTPSQSSRCCRKLRHAGERQQTHCNSDLTCHACLSFTATGMMTGTKRASRVQDRRYRVFSACSWDIRSSTSSADATASAGGAGGGPPACACVMNAQCQVHRQASASHTGTRTANEYSRPSAGCSPALAPP